MNMSTADKNKPLLNIKTQKNNLLSQNVKSAELLDNKYITHIINTAF